MRLGKDDRQPWERQKGETQKAFEAFCIYRDMGADRSLSKVSQQLGKHKVLLQRWSSRWQWVLRVEAWDDHLDQGARRENEKRVKAMAERHANQAMLFQQKLVERLRTINPEDLSPADLARWFDVAVKVERLSRGEPTENVRQEDNRRDNNELAKRILSDPEARRLAGQLLGRIIPGSAGTGGPGVGSER
jgi:hypothetical protein